MTLKKPPKPRKRKLKERREHDPFSPENPFDGDDGDEEIPPVVGEKNEAGLCGRNGKQEVRLSAESQSARTR